MMDNLPFIPPNTERFRNKFKVDFFKLISVVCTISLIVIAILMSSTFYYNYKNDNQWTLFPKTNMTCEAPIIPECPKAPDCKLTCGNLSCGNSTLVAPAITIKINNTNISVN